MKIDKIIEVLIAINGEGQDGTIFCDGYKLKGA